MLDTVCYSGIEYVWCDTRVCIVVSTRWSVHSTKAMYYLMLSCKMLIAQQYHYGCGKLFRLLDKTKNKIKCDTRCSKWTANTNAKTECRYHIRKKKTEEKRRQKTEELGMKRQHQHLYHRFGQSIRWLFFLLEMSRQKIQGEFECEQRNRGCG